MGVNIKGHEPVYTARQHGASVRCPCGWERQEDGTGLEAQYPTLAKAREAWDEHLSKALTKLATQRTTEDVKMIDDPLAVL